VNRNLGWAFVETGSLIVINQRGLAGTHVVRLYHRVKRAKNHQKAVVAVARHLAEAAWLVESNTQYPTNSGLLNDGARVLTRTMKKIEQKAGGLKRKIRDRKRSVAKRVIAIAHAPRNKGREEEEKHESIGNFSTKHGRFSATRERFCKKSTVSRGVAEGRCEDCASNWKRWRIASRSVVRETKAGSLED
jgi:hypothetical protein